MKINTSEIINHFGIIDLFLCSSGFEERSTFLGKSLDNTKVDKAYLFHLKDNYVQAEINSEEINKNLPHITIITYPRHRAIETFDIFYHFFDKQINYNKNLNVVIDITTFTREILLVLVKILSLDRFRNVFSINLVYTPAENYPKWLSKGVRDIRSIFGYSGLHLPSKKLMLIVLNGFEVERTKEIIDSFEPNRLLLGKPSELNSINKKLNKISCERFEEINERYHSLIIEDFEFSCKNVLETKKVLDKLVNKYQNDYNIVISPLNNKISTLSVALLAIENENVQVCYASANQYNIKSYSKSSDYFFVFNLNELLQQN
ncbi:hypothetical protein VP395_00670 [Mariniflexile soesokkakense]|uniref:Uncharacterized protein n=1 Tax=Mariniflexile soesokkakense TaxID=1343160 RepID=A0ABV0A8P1_9FLAO